MSQKSISAFFKPVQGVKRTTSSPSAIGTDDSSGKKPKIDGGMSTGPASGSGDMKHLGQRIESISSKNVALSPNIGRSWFKALEPEFDKPYFRKLSASLAEERKRTKIYPPEHQVYTWTHHFDISDVKAVILGQDPYHGAGQAHGLAFSVQKGVRPPPSLDNIFKELADDITGFKRPTHGDLTGWAEQGVLLLNTCLTVRSQNANSHSNLGWQLLTDAVIKYINDKLCGVVFLLWGSNAHEKCNKIDQAKHVVLKSSHPSPLSAYRGFQGCKHFSKTNEALKKFGKTQIDWSSLP